MRHFNKKKQNKKIKEPVSLILKDPDLSNVFIDFSTKRGPRKMRERKETVDQKVIEASYSTLGSQGEDFCCDEVSSLTEDDMSTWIREDTLNGLDPETPRDSVVCSYLNYPSQI